MPEPTSSFSVCDDEQEPQEAFGTTGRSMLAVGPGSIDNVIVFGMEIQP